MPNKGTKNQIARICAVFALTFAMILGGLAMAPATLAKNTPTHVTLADTFKVKIGGECPTELTYAVPTGDLADQLAETQLYSASTGEGKRVHHFQFCAEPGATTIIDAWAISPLTDGVIVPFTNYSDKESLVDVTTLVSGEAVTYLNGYAQTAFETKVIQVIGASQSWQNVIPDCGWKLSDNVNSMLVGAHTVKMCIDQTLDSGDTTVTPTGNGSESTNNVSTNGNDTATATIDSDTAVCTQGYTKNATRGVLQIPTGCDAIAYSFQTTDGVEFCNSDTLGHPCYTKNAPFQFQIVDGVRVPNDDEVPSGTPDFFSTGS